MMTRAETLYAWLWRIFEGRPFTVGEFEVTFPSPRPHQVLSELKLKGFVERVGRGAYRAVPPERWARGRASLTVQDVHRIVGEAAMPYAFTASSAVRVWTRGRYAAGSSHGYHPVEIAVRTRDARRWKAFLAARGLVGRDAERRGTAAGVEVVFYRRPSLTASRFDGVPVDPKARVLAYVRRNASVFAPAEGMIRDA